ncbi:hypothetical protein GCM10009760_13870 [Kitasatospora kazusensis]|uniref:Secreted protein n=1 Tax=Kitasatospora kazusensis TaxID=407974 RepID=A0ABN2Z1K4_9ACTN
MTLRGCARGSVGVLWTRAALAASGGMSIGWWSRDPAATSSRSTAMDPAVACSTVPAVGAAGARLATGRRAGRGRVAWSVGKVTPGRSDRRKVRRCAVSGTVRPGDRATGSLRRARVVDAAGSCARLRLPGGAVR